LALTWAMALYGKDEGDVFRRVLRACVFQRRRVVAAGENLRLPLPQSICKHTVKKLSQSTQIIYTLR